MGKRHDQAVYLAAKRLYLKVPLCTPGDGCQAGSHRKPLAPPCTNGYSKSHEFSAWFKSCNQFHSCKSMSALPQQAGQAAFTLDSSPGLQALQITMQAWAQACKQHAFSTPAPVVFLLDGTGVGGATL